MHRQFAATAPDQLWVADITYIPTWAGFLYLAVVLDMFNRRVVGWAMATHLRTELVLDALDMALGRRRPLNVVHHSDQGCQYTSIAFGKRCQVAGVRPSMGSVGDCFDNAAAESFFATLESELLARIKFRRGFLQHAPPSLQPRLPLTLGVRKKVCSYRWGSNPLPVHESGVTPLNT